MSHLASDPWGGRLRLVSGGQTGVDRAALDAALALGLPCGGWCPRGRRAEDGPIPLKYPLCETPWWGYPQRTHWNVRDSDATLILTTGPLDRGTALTEQLARRLRRPTRVLRLETTPDPQATAAWVRTLLPATLNVAGPRESSQPGIQAQAFTFLYRLLYAGATSPVPPGPA